MALDTFVERDHFIDKQQKRKAHNTNKTSLNFTNYYVLFFFKYSRVVLNIHISPKVRFKVTADLYKIV